jgi:hypothetical protein
MRNKGKPAGKAKPGGTGVPSVVKAGSNQKDNRITKTYTDNDDKVASHVRTKHPNRNVNKPDATNAGGYKN